MVEIDFTLFTNKNQTKTFGFLNADDTVYSFVGSTVKLTIYDSPTNIEINGSIDVVNGKVSFVFTTSDTTLARIVEYGIEETKQDLSKVPLIQGNLTIKDYVPFSATIEAYLNTELPANISLSEDFRNQKIDYWRTMLMDGFSIDALVMNNESSWPKLANVLIAKLVAYDALMMAVRGSFMAFMGGDYTSTAGIGSAGVKSIETGPTKVEFESVSKALSDFLKAGPNGSTLDVLLSDLCGLASYLKIKVPMCKGSNLTVFPRYYQNPDWAYPKLNEPGDFPNPVPSQG